MNFAWSFVLEIEKRFRLPAEVSAETPLARVFVLPAPDGDQTERNGAPNGKAESPRMVLLGKCEMGEAAGSGHFRCCSRYEN
ncbi:uncharacterized protein J3R85_015407 [Psidium guajava]|nr:uncharacterized protein J3R85_015407 [Psidium guajava]